MDSLVIPTLVPILANICSSIFGGIKLAIARPKLYSLNQEGLVGWLLIIPEG